MAFFSKTRLKEIKVKDGSNPCTSCKIGKACKKKSLVQGIGNDNADIMVVLDFPNKNVAHTGNLRTSGEFTAICRKLKDNDINLKDVYFTFAVKCNITKTGLANASLVNSKTISACRNHLMKEIESVKPNLVISAGFMGLNVIFANEYKGSKDVAMGITRGYVVPYAKKNEHRFYVGNVFSPRFVSEKVENFNPQAETIFDQDFKKVLAYRNNQPKYIDYEALLDLRMWDKETEPLLDELLANPPAELTIDIEATGLKPYDPGHKVLVIGLSDGYKAWAFPVPKSNRVDKKLRELLTHPKIRYIAHNMKFELAWFKEKYDIELDFVFDTMIGTHIVESRTGNNGLKHQTFVNFGVGDYSEESKKFIKAKPQPCEFDEGVSVNHANLINRMEEFPLVKNLRYCAYDCLFTHRLFWRLEDRLDKLGRMFPLSKKKMHGYDLLHQATYALYEVERNGFKVDTEYLHKTIQELRLKKKDLMTKLMDSPFVKDWKKYHTKTYNTAFKVTSGQQLSYYLYDYLDYPVMKRTEKGAPAVDGEALEMLELDELTDLIAYKDTDKVLTTFMKGLWYERNNDLMRAFFNPANVISYRLSSSNINMQNIPKKNKWQKEIVRQALLPHDGQYLMEIDYTALEVYCQLAYTKCPTTEKYLMDESVDQHIDNATELYVNLEGSDNLAQFEGIITKGPARDNSKSATFAWSYGDYWAGVAKKQWHYLPRVPMNVEKFGKDYMIMDYLADNGVETYEQWEAHVKEVEERIWRKKFIVDHEWKKANYTRYQKKGYFTSYSGMIYNGLFKRNNVNNYASQGLGGNIILYDIVKINNFIREKGLKSKIIGTIHDSIVLSIEPSETSVLLPYIKYVCNTEVYKNFKGFKARSTIGFDVCEVGQDWSHCDEIEYDDLLKKYEKCA